MLTLMEGAEPSSDEPMGTLQPIAGSDAPAALAVLLEQLSLFTGFVSSQIYVCCECDDAFRDRCEIMLNFSALMSAHKG